MFLLHLCVVKRSMKKFVYVYIHINVMAKTIMIADAVYHALKTIKEEKTRVIARLFWDYYTNLN